MDYDQLDHEPRGCAVIIGCFILVAMILYMGVQDIVDGLRRTRWGD